METAAALAELMQRARQRIKHLYAIVAVLMALISLAALDLSLDTPRGIAALAVWITGCLLILGLGLVWYRSRKAATLRLTTALARSELVRVVEHTRILFVAIPFGWEVDVELASGERLSFGFWTEADCLGLNAIVASTPPFTPAA